MINEIAGGYVKTEVQNGVGEIEFFHPASNSLPGALLEAIAKAIHAAGSSQEIKTIVLKSGGNKAFCAGASFDELIQITNSENGFAFFSGFAKVINEMRRSPKLIIARIHGKCVGGGVGIAAAADYSVALSTADVKLSELALGIGPFVVGPAVERKIGNAAFAALSIDASTWRSAEWAKQHGLFSEIHDHIEQVDESVKRLSTVLAGYSPEAMHDLKKALWEGTGHWDQLLSDRARISGRLVLSDFTKNEIEKFKSRKRS